MMEIGGHLSFPRQFLHWVTLPHRLVTLDIIQHSGGKHKETTVNPPAIATRFLLEARHFMSIEVQDPEPAGRERGCQRSKRTLIAMKFQQAGNVHIAYAITIGTTEIFTIIEICGDTLDAAAGQGAFAGLHQCYPPRLGITLMHFHLVLRHVKSDIRHVQKVVGKVFLDQIALITEANHEVIDAMAGVDFHDVPENRLSADIHHGFGASSSLLGKAGAKSTRQYHGLHNFRFAFMKYLLAKKSEYPAVNAKLTIGCRNQAKSFLFKYPLMARNNGITIVKL